MRFPRMLRSPAEPAAAAPEPTPEPTPTPTPEPAPEPTPSVGDNIVWPDNWREGMAGGDEDVAKELGRYSEVGLVGKALVDAQKRIRAANMIAREPYPEEGNAKQKTQWRKDNGIPKEEAGYFDKMPEGMAVADEDKDGMDLLAKHMHAAHAPSASMHAAMGAYNEHVQNVLATQAEMDITNSRAADDAMFEAYGAERRVNENDLEGWATETFGAELWQAIRDSRTSDGMALGHNPAFLKSMVAAVRKMHPFDPIPGLGGGDPVAAVADEIATIEKTIQTDNATYRADKVMQDRYLELLTARDKRK